MSLPFNAALAVKLLCWLVALAVFFRLLARYAGFAGPQRRRLLTAMVLGVLAGSKAVQALTYPAFFLAPQDLVGDRALAWLSGDSIVGALLGGRLALWLASACLEQAGVGVNGGVSSNAVARPLRQEAV